MIRVLRATLLLRQCWCEWPGVAIRNHSDIQTQLPLRTMPMAHVIIGDRKNHAWLNPKGQSVLALPYTGPGQSGPIPCWTLQQKSWSDPHEKAVPNDPAQERWHPAFCIDGPTPHHGCWRASPECIDIRKLAPPEEAALGAISDQLKHQAIIQDLGFTCPNLYLIYDLLEPMKGLVLWNDTYRVSMTQSVLGVCERRFREGPVKWCIRNERPWTTLTIHYYANLQVKLIAQRVYCVTPRLPLTLRWMKKLERWEWWKSKVGFCCCCCCCIFGLVSL